MTVCCLYLSDTGKIFIFRFGEEIDLTVREFDAFHLLISNRRRVITFEMISDRVWGYDYETTTPKTIHSLMSRIKQKLKIAPDVPDYISSVRGVGYKFNL